MRYSLFLISSLIALSYGCAVRQPLPALTLSFPSFSCARSEHAVVWHRALQEYVTLQGSTCVGGDYCLETDITSVKREPALHDRSGRSHGDTLTVTIAASLKKRSGELVWQGEISERGMAFIPDEHVWRTHFLQAAEQNVWYACAQQLYETLEEVLGESVTRN